MMNPNRLLFLLMGLLSALCLSSQTGAYVFVSSTGKDANAGITILKLDGVTGKLALQARDRTISQTGYLTLSPGGDHLYAIDRDYVHAFKISKHAPRLGYLNKSAIAGRGPCHISTNSMGTLAFVANYSGGQILSYEINTDGSIGQLKDSVQHHNGSGVDENRQKGPHPHMAFAMARTNHLMVPDLGADQVYVYDVTESGALRPVKKKGIVPPGGGPRHFAVHPRKDFAYVLNELSGSVTMFKYNAKNGKLKAKQTISTLSPTNSKSNKSADIHITPNGQYLYASNRGPNTIAVFEIDQKKGSLIARGDFSCGGDWPRAFGIDPSGSYLVVANKNSNNVVTFKIDYQTGLAQKVDDMSVTAPQCVKFLAIK